MILECNERSGSLKREHADSEHPPNKMPKSHSLFVSGMAIPVSHTFPSVPCPFHIFQRMESFHSFQCNDPAEGKRPATEDRTAHFE